MQRKYFFTIILLVFNFCFFAGKNRTADDSKVIIIKKSHVQLAPKTASINATINGHALSVIFTENLGIIHIEITDTNGIAVDLTDMYTPSGYNAYIHYAGSYVVTFTLGNGDEYYGEFDVENRIKLNNKIIIKIIN